MNRPLIPFADYQRIYQSIYSILRSEKADVGISCLYFSVFGARILKEYYKIDAKPVAGIAAYKIGNGEDDQMLFGDVNGDTLECTLGGFHAWIQADGWLIDFAAPVFPELIKARGVKIPCVPKMLQKELGGMATSLNELNNIGDFFLEVDTDVVDQHLQLFSSIPVNMDLAVICCEWYRRPPKKMQKDKPIQDLNGNINHVSLCGPPLVGVL